MDGRDQDMAANTSRWALGNASAHGHRRSPEASSRAKCGMQLPVWGRGACPQSIASRVSASHLCYRDFCLSLWHFDVIESRHHPYTTLILMAADL